MRLIYFVLVIVCFVSINAQEKPKVKINDSLSIKIENKVRFDNLEGSIINPDKFIYKEKDFLLLQSKMLVEQSQYSGFSEEPIELPTGKSLLSPLYQQYMDGQTNRSWMSILGAVQAGAVGYLAYKHIKKYGFK